MSRLFLLPLLLCNIPLAVSLRCYSCWFPSISPADCLQNIQECPAGQRCLASTAVGIKGPMRMVLFEKSCAISTQCDLSGEKHTAGINFTYTNKCCDTDLCNAADTSLGVPLGTVLGILMILLTLALC